MIHLKANSLTNREQVHGICYLLFQFLVLPYLLGYANAMLPQRLTEAQLNFCFYCINFFAVVLIFGRFLSGSFSSLKKGFWWVVQAAALGFIGYALCNWLLTFVLGKLFPSFSNVNDAAVISLYRSSPILMAVGTVLLVPLVEECLFRVLIFRRLYGSSRPAAYILSVIFFGGIHVMGYFGKVSPGILCLCFIQYIPAGVWLAWAYQKGGNIFASVAMHASINALAIYLMR